LFLITAYNMTSEWIAYLTDNGANIDPVDNQNIFFPNARNNESLTPLAYLGAFAVKGEDAAQFLQGQLTCNINEVTEQNASLAAFCNAKGRVISTLLICKQAEEFIVIAPLSLVQTVIRKLTCYILRAKVTIDDISNQYCLLGLTSDRAELGQLALPIESFAVSCHNNIYIVKLPGKTSRYLLIASCPDSKHLWENSINQGDLSPGNTTAWRFLDISSGLPWFNATMTEEYIPQMLNIDKFGGISFNKGCYTGQEIVARTHYLGKTKRELCLAECNKSTNIQPETIIIDSTTGDSVGKILTFQSNENILRLLLVAPVGCNQNQLALNTSGHDKINIIPFQ
jgi:tRNA-modifying protein YgfZ